MFLTNINERKGKGKNNMLLSEFFDYKTINFEELQILGNLFLKKFKPTKKLSIINSYRILGK